MKLIDSEEEVSDIYSIYNSTIAEEKKFSTVGNEVMFLREGYRKDCYLPSLNSYNYFNPDKE